MKGLTEVEARARRARGQGNDARIKSGRSYADIVRGHAFNVVNILLVVIALILVALGLLGDAAVTGVLVFVNIGVGVFQEVRAKRSLDRLAVLTRPTATVLRDGIERSVDPGEVVLGDWIVARRGDQIVVDGALVEGALEVDESLLTGESDSIPKRVGDPVMSGCLCVTGNAIYEVQKVGIESFANQLTAAARAFRDDQTPIQRDVTRVMRGIAILVAIAAIPVAVALYLQFGSFPAIETAKSAAVLVALVPQGLIVMVTVTYGLAIVRLAGQKALIQRTSAVESMSRVDLLCLDKTGTLTTQRIELADWTSIGPEAALRHDLGVFLASTTLATRSTDALKDAFPGEGQELSDEVPFSSELRWSAVCLRDPCEWPVMVVGAPEALLGHLDEGDRQVVEDQVATWTDQGLRVMLFVTGRGPISLHDDGGAPRLPDRLEPAGLLALREEVRPDARATIDRFREAGVEVVLISGDNPDTVAALTRQVGLDPGEGVMSGLELAELDDEALARAVGDASVFGRVSPALKARLVDLFRSRGRYVAMVGDGVNDVLSLKKAHLGISMQSGSQATRAVADIVLLDDSFSALPSAVVEGQRVIAGMQDSMHLFLVRTLYMALLVFGVSLLGTPFPVTPKHNTVVALITVGLPVLFLVVWARPVQQIGITLRETLRPIFPPAIAVALVGVPLYEIMLTGGDLQLTRTVLTTFAVGCGLLLIPMLGPPIGDSPIGGRIGHPDWRPTALAVGLLAVYVSFFFVAPARDFFELSFLSVEQLLLTVGCVAVWCVLVLAMWRIQLTDRLGGSISRMVGAMRRS